MRTIFCNIGWMRKYEGPNNKDDYEKPINGGTYNYNHVGHEINNFRVINGYCYGNVQPPNNGTVLHLHENFGLAGKKLMKIDDLRIIWIAKPPESVLSGGSRVVGCYNHATAFRELQHHNDSQDPGYYFMAKAEDCYLIPEMQRPQFTARNFRNLWYVYDNKPKITQRDWGRIDECNQFLEAYIIDQITNESSFQTNEVQKTYIEGYKKHIENECTIRNSSLVANAKAQFTNANGGLFCEVCGFDFVKFYGELGADFIEAHHNVPLSSRGHGETKMSDLSMVCPNCHRMLHRKPNITVAELRNIIATTSKLFNS